MVVEYRSDVAVVLRMHVGVEGGEEEGAFLVLVMLS